MGTLQRECPHLFLGLQSVMTHCRSGVVGYHLCDSFYRTRALSKIMGDEKGRD